MIHPLLDPHVQIQPASVDLRLGHSIRVFQHRSKPFIDSANHDPEDYTHEFKLKDGERLIIHPGEFLLANTIEWLMLPPDLVGKVDGRSSIGRLGILIHATAGFIDPGFQGELTLEISNVGVMPVALYPKQRVCQISFQYLGNPCDRPYGSPGRSSKYQGQINATPSEIRLDADNPTGRGKQNSYDST